MDRLNRNVMAFAAGFAMVGSIAMCSNANAHSGHILDHDSVAEPMYCAAVYAYSAAYLARIGEDELAESAVNRTKVALNLSAQAANEYGHTGEQFGEAVTHMYYSVGHANFDDAFALAEYLDCDGMTVE